MTVEEFAKYVVDNMHRATLSNALKIADKLDNPSFYKFEEFVVCMQKYLVECLSTKKLSDAICYEILGVISKTLKKYKSDIKYCKMYIIDDFIIDLWEALDKRGA